jgi:hypothetical protein
MKKKYISLIFWFLSFAMFSVYITFNFSLEKLRNETEALEKKLNRMIAWSEEIKAYRSQFEGSGQNLLAMIDTISKKYNIQLQSARPVQNFIEISARGVPPDAMISFLSELQNSESSVIVKVKIIKNFADENSNDFEILVAPK